MSVAAVSHYLNTVSRLAALHYIKVTTGVVTAAGGIWVSARNRSFRYNERLDKASTRVNGNLKTINPQLETWNEGKHDAKALLKIFNDICAKDNPLPHLEFVGPAKHFRTAVDHVKKLTSIVDQVSAAQDNWLKKRKEEAEKWLEDHNKLCHDAGGDLTGVKNADSILLANHNLSTAIKKAKKPINEKEVTAKTIQLSMSKVKKKYDILYGLANNSNIEILVGKSLLPIKKWFPDDDGNLKTLSNEELTDIYTEQGKIKGDNKTKVDEAIAGLGHEELLKRVDRDEEGSDAKIAYDEFKKWNDADNRLHRPLQACAVISLTILAANWGLPRYLGPDHRFVKFFNLPA